MNTAHILRPTIQDIQLDLIERASFNDFDGKIVKRSLLANKSLWKRAIMGRFDSFPLIPLRDIADDIWNVDTLMIVPQAGKETTLTELAATWGPDEINWLEENEAALLCGGSECKILRLWWD